MNKLLLITVTLLTITPLVSLATIRTGITIEEYKKSTVPDEIIKKVTEKAFDEVSRYIYLHKQQEGFGDLINTTVDLIHEQGRSEDATRFKKIEPTSLPDSITVTVFYSDYIKPKQLVRIVFFIKFQLNQSETGFNKKPVSITANGTKQVLISYIQK